MKHSTSEFLVSGRRQFLRAVGGGLIAMPFLESLLPKEARSQSAPTPKFFAAMTTGHGSVWFENMFPSQGLITETGEYAGRTIRRGDLTPEDVDGKAQLSPVLRASADRLSPAIASKLNVIAGFDVPYYLGHHSGGHLGNFGPNANDAGIGEASPTIDQVMAYSPSFYGNLGTILQRSLHFGLPARPASWNFANPSAKTGNIQAIKATANTLEVFDSIFKAPSETPTNQRVPVVDRVFQNYKRLVDANPRLSTADRTRLEDHMARLSEIQRRTEVVANCSGITRPTKNAERMFEYPGPEGFDKAVEAYQLLNDVVVAAFLCGTSRIAVIAAHEQLYPLFSDFVGDWHQVAHTASGGRSINDAVREAQNWMVHAQQSFFEFAFLDLVNKLNVDNGNGKTLLDDTLVSWTQESCHVTHFSHSVPIVTAGGAGGALRTGSYIDYRNLEIEKKVESEQLYNPGLLYNQWLGVELQAMGVPREEFEIPEFHGNRPSGAGTGGYGTFFLEDTDDRHRAEHYRPALGSVLSEIPPFLAAG
jgi:hypothetical protein